MGVSNLQLSRHVCGWDYRKSGRQAGRQAARVLAVQDEAMGGDGMRCDALRCGA